MDFDSEGVRLHYEVNGPEKGMPLVAVHGDERHSLLGPVDLVMQSDAFAVEIHGAGITLCDRDE